MKNKQKNRYTLPIILYAAIDLLLFSSGYFYIRSLVDFFDPQIILLINIVISFLIALTLKTTTFKKLQFIIIASLGNSFIGFLLILSTMFLPGSREHNYVMYHICLPAIKKHYHLKENEGFPDTGQYDKNGQQKWWYQHSECEENVWNGKGPVFSEDPPGFVPVKE